MGEVARQRRHDPADRGLEQVFPESGAEKLTAINGYSHGVHPSGEAFPWSTTAFAAKLDGEKSPATWTMRRNFIAGIRLLNGWLPKESESTVDPKEAIA